MKKIFLLIIILLPGIVLAKDNYNISFYDISITANNNELEYQESIDIKTEQPNVEITKYIDEDTEFIVSSTNDIEIKNNYFKIKNGLNFEQKYTLNYKVYNSFKNKKILIANNYNASVEKTTFKLTLPFNISEYSIKYYLNDTLLTQEDLNITIDNNILKGIYNKKLSNNDKIYIKIEEIANKKSILLTINIILPMSFVIISCIIWLLYGKDQKIKKKKVNRPPKTLTPLEFSLVYNGEAKSEDILLNVIELANKGYIKIKETTKNNYELIKLKDYDGKNKKENNLFNSIFRDDSSLTLSEYIDLISNKEVKKQNLKDKLSFKEFIKKFKTISKINLSSINSNSEKNKYFEEKSENKKMILIIMVAIILLLITCTPFYEMNYLFYIPFSLIFSIITLSQIIKLTNYISSQKITFKSFLMFITLMIVVWLLILIPTFEQDIIYLINYFLGAASVVIILIIYNFMSKRTPYGIKQLSNIEGFKEFIIKCKEEDLKDLLIEDEEYIYEILPYTYPIGVNDTLINKLKKMDISKPKWFESKEKTALIDLNKFIIKYNKILKETLR